ncbi:hypothetical protein R69927_01977 [Paraburkholderia domus]|jgi:hypothetical protein|uniref:Uncharacterized protein n=1 Tax=Paraburkholderia domus TaxID=2793075 RepID=A0A9N8R6Q3_9BURK|nr:hypothetical protein R70006_02288 [Paraburkholderia domus]CAE6763529.1 hypothetical protein R69749_00903 [Paraburkholderia domus]CAE6778567.1 hypothetical protein R75483_04332 [Paraburkholderia domus]CAE6849240.1 hypothetical protein R69927_01977 [Paraburkholderia domus]CAE6895595.1 hypothetical protein R70199_03381 [Paraburkholderia domus]
MTTIDATDMDVEALALYLEQSVKGFSGPVTAQNSQAVSRIPLFCSRQQAASMSYAGSRPDRY